MSRNAGCDCDSSSRALQFSSQAIRRLRQHLPREYYCILNCICKSSLIIIKKRKFKPKTHLRVWRVEKCPSQQTLWLPTGGSVTPTLIESIILLNSIQNTLCNYFSLDVSLFHFIVSLYRPPALQGPGSSRTSLTSRRSTSVGWSDLSTPQQEQWPTTPSWSIFTPVHIHSSTWSTIHKLMCKIF